MLAWFAKLGCRPSARRRMLTALCSPSGTDLSCCFLFGICSLKSFSKPYASFTMIAAVPLSRMTSGAPAAMPRSAETTKPRPSRCTISSRIISTCLTQISPGCVNFMYVLMRHGLASALRCHRARPEQPLHPVLGIREDHLNLVTSLSLCCMLVLSM